MGLTGYKGRVHVAFGEPLSTPMADAKAVAKEVDRQILSNYRLYPSNFLAFENLPQAPELPEPARLEISRWREEVDSATLKIEEQRFQQRLAACPEAQRPWLLLQYANPVISRARALELSAEQAQG